MSIVQYKLAAPSSTNIAAGLVTGKYQYQDGDL